LYKQEHKVPMSCAFKPPLSFSPEDFLHDGTFSPPATDCSIFTAGNN
jgi:hypothetical protein